MSALKSVRLQEREEGLFEALADRGHATRSQQRLRLRWINALLDDGQREFPFSSDAEQKIK
ncbi:hypothetical protein [Burkholderia contaminans]|uniref:hypothetical protein n=1 Tax=Burkholderia contaminans TaxID=488447 RepID=UPI001C2EB58A|nr:hypothetical protein [Burkholderia contaminans]